MQRIIQKYTGFLRNLRVVHYIYNLFHRKGLKHNLRLYPYFKINKSIYESISHKDFVGKKAKLPYVPSSSFCCYTLKIAKEDINLEAIKYELKNCLSHFN